MRLTGDTRERTRGSEWCAFPDYTPLSGYQYGCRCQRCLNGHREYHRRYHNRGDRPAPKYWRSSKQLGPPRRYIPWRARKQYPNAKGYVVVSLWGLDHPLNQGGTAPVLVHRLVLWEKLAGDDALCWWCGKALTWFVDLHVDHLDNDKTNNDPTNVVPACAKCNGSKADSAGPRHVIW